MGDSLNEYIALMPLNDDQGSGEDLETTEPVLAELPQTSDSDEADDRENIWSPILFQISPMSAEESDGPSDDASMESDGASDGYMGDIESGIEIDDYTVNPREDIWQEDLMIISAEQHIANGLFRLTQFRIPSPMPAICPICQINK